MATAKVPETSERESLKVAEASRQAEWTQPSFMRELFLGNFRLDLIHPYPLPGAERPEFTAYYDEMKRFLREEVDSVEIDATAPRKRSAASWPTRPCVRSAGKPRRCLPGRTA